MKYLAIIGDVIGSRQLNRREEFQARLSAVLKARSHLNRALVSPYTITLGDEFQAVYRSADALFRDLIAILAAIHPVRARFAIGVGELSTAINRKQALGMDGPAFHRARAAMTELKDSPYLIRIQGSTPPDETADASRLLNPLFNLVTHRVRGWSRNRLRILEGLLAEKTVAELEKELRISKVAVYKNINAAALDEVRTLCEEVTRLLNRELKQL